MQEGHETELVGVDRAGSPKRLGAFLSGQDGALAAAASAAAKVVKPPRFGGHPRTADFRRRVVYLEEDVRGLTTISGWLMEDVSGLLKERSPRDQKVAMIAHVAATAVAVLGGNPATLVTWVTLVVEETDPELADKVTSQVIEELLLLHGEQAGEA